MTTIPENEFIKPFIESHRKLLANIVTTCGTMHGWATAEKCCTLASLVLANKPALAVEIGVWGGRSLLPVAMAMKAIGQGRIIGIDPWDAQVSAQDEIPDSAEWWAAQDHEKLYKTCLVMIRGAGVESVVNIVRKKSDDVDPPANIGLIHIDGSHTGQAVKDTCRFLPNVTGHVIFDDLTWVGGGVLRAMDVAEEMGFKEIFRCVNDKGDNWAIFKK